MMELFFTFLVGALMYWMGYVMGHARSSAFWSKEIGKAVGRIINERD